MSLESNFFVGVLYFCFRFGFLVGQCCLVDVNGTTYISNYLRSGMERKNNVWPLGLGGDSTLARIFRQESRSLFLPPPKTILSRFISFLKLSRIIFS